jgi:hypothetical protein
VKRRTCLIVLLCFAACGPALGQPRGGILKVRLSNGTTGGPGRAEKVTLFRLRDGMVPVKEAGPVEGSFQMDGIEVEGERPMLLQVTSRGVNYNEPVQFGRGYEAEAEITVYDVFSQWNERDLELETTRVLLRREGERLLVDEVHVVENRSSPPKTYHDPNGGFRFHIPTGSLRELRSVSARGESGMPVPQQASPLPDGSGYVTRTAFKPGETELVVSYEVDYSGSGYRMESRVFYPLPEYYVFVAPPDVKVEASGWENLGLEPEGRFAAFRKRDVAAGSVVSMSLSGGSSSGMSEGSAAGRGDGSPSSGEGAQVSILPDRSHYSKAVVVMFMAAALAFGLLRTLYPSRPSKPQKRS